MVNNVNIELPYIPHSGQLQVLKSKARFKVLLCGRRWGKSLVSQVIAVMGIFQRKQIGYVTPDHKLGKEFFNEVIKWIPVDAIQSANKTDLKIELKNGGSLSFLSGENIENQTRGRKFHTIIIDEATKIKDLETVWSEQIRATLMDYQGNALFISTPRGKDYFYSLYLKGLSGDNDFESFHFTTYDNPHILQSEIDAARDELTDSAFRQEILAEPTENANAVIPVSYIEANTIKELSTYDTVVFGIDLAKYKDWTVITGLDASGTMSYFNRFQKPWEQTKDIIKALPLYTQKVIDSTGVGDPIFEELSLTVPNLRSFKFTSITKPQIVKKLALDIEKGELKFNQHTANELTVFEYKYTSTGYIKYEASSGNTDDAVMSLALANYYKLDSVPVDFEDRFFIG